MYFNQKSILAADYLRLSREDGDKLESDSIRNQRSLINDFVKQHKEIQLVEEYIDDGYTVERTLLGLDSDTFYIYHVAAVMVDNLRRLLLGINLSDKAIMDFDFPGVGFPV